MTERLSAAAGAIRKLAGQINSQGAGSTPLRVLQGEVVNVGVGGELTIIADGGNNPITGWKYLLDAYEPTIGDIVWILDAGPASKIVLGPTQRA